MKHLKLSDDDMTLITSALRTVAMADLTATASLVGTLPAEQIRESYVDIERMIALANTLDNFA